jgi:hypothetical protein
MPDKHIRGALQDDRHRQGIAIDGNERIAMDGAATSAALSRGPHRGAPCFVPKVQFDALPM